MDKLNIGAITCWYKAKSCARYAYGLINALDNIGVHSHIISANCLCYRDDPFRNDLFFSPCTKVRFRDMYWQPAPKPVQYLRAIGEVFGDGLKGKKYLRRLQNFPLLHYQQVGGSYGFLPLLSFLTLPTKSKRVVTVHEIDKHQKGLSFKSRHLPIRSTNKVYNKADAVIVMTEDMKRRLRDLGVRKEKLHVIPHGVDIPDQKKKSRTRIMFCGGHHLTTGKGFDIFTESLLILRGKGYRPPVCIYGLNKEYGQEEGRHWIEKVGISPQVEWLDYDDDELISARFQEAMFMVIPYATSEVGAAATRAMANAVPVIGTRRMGLPEYLGAHGLFMDDGSPESLAKLMERLINEKNLRESLGRNLQERARQKYAWPVIARQTAELYNMVIRQASA